MPTRKKYSYTPVTNEEALLFCKTCRDFLTDFSKGMDVNVEDYLTPDKRLRNLTLQNIFLQIIKSATNTGRKSNTIEFSNRRDPQRKNKILQAISGIPNLADENAGFTDQQIKEILCRLKELDVARALANLKSAQVIKTERTNFWEGWLRSVKDAASFVLTYASGKEFSDFFGQFHGRSLILGPYFLSQQIYGIGFALACDVLKDLGASELIKPDTHIKKVFYGLSLVKKHSDEAVLDAAVRLVEQANEARQPEKPEITPFQLDKMIWLCCSGTFYKTPGLKKPGQREKLIARLRKALGR